MQAVILAAGKGTRMGDLTKNTPKPLLQIKGKTLLEWNLENLPEEITEVIIVVGYLGGQIQKKFGTEFGARQITYVKQKELKGTAHAIFLCKNILRGRFLVLTGDDLFDKRDLEKLIENPLALLVWRLTDEQDNSDLQGGLVKINEVGELINIVERAPGGSGVLINAAAYVLNKDFFKYPLVGAGKPAKEFGLPQTLLQMVRDGAKFAAVPAEKWRKITSPEDLRF